MGRLDCDIVVMFIRLLCANFKNLLPWKNQDSFKISTTFNNLILAEYGGYKRAQLGPIGMTNLYLISEAKCEKKKTQKA